LSIDFGTTPAHALTVPEAIWEHPSGKSDISEIMLRALAEMPASTVRSLMLVLLRWPVMTHNWRVVSLRAFRLRREAEIHDTLPVAFLGDCSTTA